MKHSNQMSGRVLTACALLLAAGCTDEAEVHPLFTIDTPTVTAEAAGGEASVTYSLKNAAAGEGVHIGQCDAAWLDAFDTSAEGVISFRVAPNDGEEERRAEVTAIHANIRRTFEVVQRGAASVPADEVFEIEVPLVRALSVQYNIAHADPAASFMVRMVKQAEIDALGSDEAIFEHELDFLEELAATHKVSFDRVVRDNIETGAKRSFATRLDAATQYYIMAYGVERKKTEGMTREDLVRSTSIVKYPVETRPLEYTSRMDFDIEYEIDEQNVTMKITPDDNEKTYYYNFDLKRNQREDLVIQYQQHIDGIISMNLLSGQHTVEQIVASLVAKKGYQEETAPFGYPNEEGEGIAFEISADGHIVSEPVSKRFTVGDVTQKELTLGIDITDIGPRSAAVAVEASDEENQWVACVGKTKDYAGMSDEQIIAALKAQNKFSLINTGSGTFAATGLTRNTDYTVFAFGYVANTVTTKLFSEAFTTADAVVADAVCTPVMEKYFNGDDLALAYPELCSWMKYMAVMPTVVQTEGDVASYCYHIWLGEMADPEKYSDDDIIHFLQRSGMKTPHTVFTTLFDGTDRTVIGVATDSEGNYGPVYRRRITLSKEDCSPAEEFDTGLL